MSLIALAALGATTLLAAPARADAPSFSIGALGGYGAEAETIVLGNTNTYRVGVGVRAALAIRKAHLGLTVVHHFGSSYSASGPGSSLSGHYTNTTIGPELGYNAEFGRNIVLRPYLGVGLLFALSRTTVQGQTAEDNHLRAYIAPGLVLTYRIGPVFFGPDVRVVVSPIEAPRKWAPTAMGTLGYAF